MEQRPFWEANSFSASQEIPAFYGTWRFITVFTTARHMSLSWASWIQSMPPSHFLKTYFNIILALCSIAPKKRKNHNLHLESKRSQWNSYCYLDSGFLHDVRSEFTDDNSELHVSPMSLVKRTRTTKWVGYIVSGLSETTPHAEIATLQFGPLCAYVGIKTTVKYPALRHSTYSTAQRGR
jgi:hypothetical protein